ncbi:MAG: sigma-70 family RNA polymerase sigma factor [Clostridiales bacterium]|nr:sigma-70 family RNA polymerase sigma factor [Clostridiales bacterium]
MNGALVPGAVYEETEEQRLERWMDEYGNAVLHTCFVCLSDVQLAEDATQDTFVKAWQGWGKFENRHAGAEKAWLLRIAINTCRDYRRGMWFRRVDLPGEMEKLPPALISVSPRERELFLDVLSLPEKHRQVILLHYYHNMTLREMGDVLGLTPSSVHSRLKKAEHMLRQGLEGRKTVEA